MANYQSTKPAAADQLNNSQDDIQKNFEAIKDLIDVNHETFAGGAGNEGKHKWTTFPEQGTDLTAAPETLANEVGKFGITVNNILPGATRTERLNEIIGNRAKKRGKTENEIVEEMLKEIPARRFGEPQELAYAAAFLASPSAAFINGVSLAVDGGRISCL